jgi:hypothetical protein
MGGEGAALAVGQFGFLELGHATTPAGVQGEGTGQAQLLAQAELERLRPQGVTALNSYIYQSMIAAATARDMSDEVARVIRNAVINAPNDGVLNPHLSAFGSAGADQVAQLAKQVALQRQ